MNTLTVVGAYFVGGIIGIAITPVLSARLRSFRNGRRARRIGQEVIEEYTSMIETLEQYDELDALTGCSPLGYSLDIATIHAAIDDVRGLIAAGDADAIERSRTAVRRAFQGIINPDRPDAFTAYEFLYAPDRADA